MTTSDRIRPSIPGGQSGWWLDDAIPGSTIYHPHGRTIDAAEHVWLAWITGNLSDVHGNADTAARGAFGDVVVLGALTVAIVLGLAEPAVGDPGSAATGLPRGWRSIALRGPVAPGDTIRSSSSIVAATPPGADGWGLVTRTIRGLNQHDEPVAVIEEVERGVPVRPR